MTKRSASYSRKGRQRQTSNNGSQVLLSPIRHSNSLSSPITSPLQQSQTNSTPVGTSPLQPSPIIGSPSERVLRSLTPKRQLRTADVFEVEDNDNTYVPSFKRRLTYVPKIPIKSELKNQNKSDKTIEVETVRLDQDKELNSQFFIEASEKPTWSPSKLKSPVRLPKQSSPSIPRTKLDFSHTPKPEPIVPKEPSVWSLLDDLDTSYKPKLVTKSASPEQKKASPRRGLNKNYEELNDMYEKLISSPKKKKSSFRVAQDTSAIQTSSLSPKGKKTYSLTRTYRADGELQEDEDNTNISREQEEEKKDIHETANIQNIHQLRLNGLNYKFNEEFDYMIENFYSQDVNLIRTGILEIALKILNNKEFHKNMQMNRLPDVFITSLVNSDDYVVNFCFVIVCFKLQENNHLISQLQQHPKRMNYLLKKLKEKELDLRLSKITQLMYNELIHALFQEFPLKDNTFYYYLFLKTFRDSLSFSMDLIDLTTLGEELFVNLEILENILTENSDAPENIVTKLAQIGTSNDDSSVMKSCQILALKSLILLSFSEKLNTQLQDNNFVNQLFDKAIKKIDKEDVLIENVRLLQLGLVFNLIDYFDPLETDSISKIDIEDGSVHSIGYMSLILGHLGVLGKIKIDGDQKEILITGLQNFKQVINELSILQKVETILQFLTT